MSAQTLNLQKGFSSLFRCTRIVAIITYCIHLPVALFDPWNRYGYYDFTETILAYAWALIVTFTILSFIFDRKAIFSGIIITLAGIVLMAIPRL